MVPVVFSGEKIYQKSTGKNIKRVGEILMRGTSANSKGVKCKLINSNQFIQLLGLIQLHVSGKGIRNSLDLEYAVYLCAFFAWKRLPNFSSSS